MSQASVYREAAGETPTLPVSDLAFQDSGLSVVNRKETLLHLK